MRMKIEDTKKPKKNINNSSITKQVIYRLTNACLCAHVCTHTIGICTPSPTTSYGYE